MNDIKTNLYTFVLLILIILLIIYIYKNHYLCYKNNNFYKYKGLKEEFYDSTSMPSPGTEVTEYMAIIRGLRADLKKLRADNELWKSSEADRITNEHEDVHNQKEIELSAATATLEQTQATLASTEAMLAESNTKLSNKHTEFAEMQRLKAAADARIITLNRTIQHNITSINDLVTENATLKIAYLNCDGGLPSQGAQG